MKTFALVIFAIASFILIIFLIENGNTLIARILCFVSIPVIIILCDASTKEDYFVPAAPFIFEIIILLIMGIFISTYLFFTNLILAALWSFIFIFIPFLLIGINTENVVVKSKWHGEKKWHERAAGFWERASYGADQLGVLANIYPLIIPILFLTFSMVTCFAQQKMYILL